MVTPSAIIQHVLLYPTWLFCKFNQLGFPSSPDYEGSYVVSGKHTWIVGIQGTNCR